MIQFEKIEKWASRADTCQRTIMGMDLQGDSPENSQAFRLALESSRVAISCLCCLLFEAEEAGADKEFLDQYDWTELKKLTKEDLGGWPTRPTEVAEAMRGMLDEEVD